MNAWWILYIANQVRSPQGPHPSTEEPSRWDGGPLPPASLAPWRIGQIQPWNSSAIWAICLILKNFYNSAQTLIKIMTINNNCLTQERKEIISSNTQLMNHQHWKEYELLWWQNLAFFRIKRLRFLLSINKKWIFVLFRFDLSLKLSNVSISFIP